MLMATPIPVSYTHLYHLGEGRRDQLEAQKDDNKGNNHPSDIFHPGMAVRMFFVSWLSGKFKTYQGDDGRTGIGQVIDGIGNHSDTPE